MLKTNTCMQIRKLLGCVFVSRFDCRCRRVSWVVPSARTSQAAAHLQLPPARVLSRKNNIDAGGLMVLLLHTYLSCKLSASLASIVRTCGTPSRRRCSEEPFVVPEIRSIPTTGCYIKYRHTCMCLTTKPPGGKLGRQEKLGQRVLTLHCPPPPTGCVNGDDRVNRPESGEHQNALQ